ncbi:MAG: iron ABC transporter permease [Pseudomonadota bacterium]
MAEATTEQDANPESLATDARTHRPTGLVVLAGVLALSLACGFSIGAIPISLWSLLTGTATELEMTVFSELRSPRVLLAGLVGASLGIAGAALQGLFRNPLADPQLIGVSSGAALGAIAMIVVGEAMAMPASVTPYAVPLAAVAGALLVTAFLYTFATVFGQFSVVTILLVGIAINALSTVGIGLFQYLSDDRQLRTLVFWLMGSFGRASWTALVPAALTMLLAVVVLMRQMRALDLLQLGEPEARHLGVNVERVKRQVVLATAVGVGTAVALSGIIGFVGLVVPHLVRLMLGALHRYVLPAAALLGAALLIAADLLARTVIVPAELPVSLVTSAIGGPFFLYLISRVRPT